MNINYSVHELTEITTCTVDRLPHFRFDYHIRLVNGTNPQMVKNFIKCCEWVKEKYPNLTGVYHTTHDTYHKLDVIINNGEMTLCYGSHGVGYSNYLNEVGSAIYSQGSQQSRPYLFIGAYGFPHDMLFKFFDEWARIIRPKIIHDGDLYKHIMEEEFDPSK